MKNKIRKILMALAMTASILPFGCSFAFANVDPTWEETVLETEVPAEPVVVEETVETEPEQAFSTPGNGDLGDEIPSGQKDFYTIHTKSNNTFYLVIDHSGNVDNVYMLSLIDEGDLSEFLDDTEKETEPEPQVVILPEITKEQEPEPAITPEPEPVKEKNSNPLSLAVLALAAFGGVYYYFKIYKPKKAGEHFMSEGMESVEEGMNTVNEDKENE